MQRSKRQSKNGSPLTAAFFFLTGLAILTPPAPKAGTDETDGSSPLSSKTGVGTAGPFPLALVAPFVAAELEAFDFGTGVDAIGGADGEFDMSIEIIMRERKAQGLTRTACSRFNFRFRSSTSWN